MKGDKHLHILVSEKLLGALQAFATLREVPCSAIVRSALEDFLERKELEGLDLVLERLASLESRMRSIRLDLEALGELVSFFIYYWFCYTPTVPDSQKRALASEAQSRHRQFLLQLSRKLQKGEFSLAELLESRIPNEQENPLQETDSADDVEER